VTRDIEKHKYNGAAGERGGGAAKEGKGGKGKENGYRAGAYQDRTSVTKHKNMTAWKIQMT